MILLLLLAVLGLVGLVIGTWSLVSLQKDEEEARRTPERHPRSSVPNDQKLSFRKNSICLGDPSPNTPVPSPTRSDKQSY